MPKLYRKRPVTIEAVEWTGDNLAEVRDFTRRADGFSAILAGQTNVLVLDTPAGPVRVHPGDRVIRGVMPDDFYPCKPATFAATYEDVL